MEHIVSVFPQNIHTSSRNVVSHASLDGTKHGHSFLTYPEPFLSEHKPYGDVRPQLSGALAEHREDLKYEPPKNRARLAHVVKNPSLKMVLNVMFGIP